jgi:(p)ppGpp synthase/HD superfamily hydrolase
MALHGFVWGVNLFTPCHNEKTFTHLLRLITYIIGVSELHFNRQQGGQVKLAIQLSAEWHKGYYRKDDVTPYLIHPLEVAALLLLLGVYDFKIGYMLVILAEAVRAWCG